MRSEASASDSSIFWYWLRTINESEALNRFKGQGLAGFLQKPYRVSAFVEAVRKALAPVSSSG